MTETKIRPVIEGIRAETNGGWGDPQKLVFQLITESGQLVEASVGIQEWEAGWQTEYGLGNPYLGDAPERTYTEDELQAAVAAARHEERNRMYHNIARAKQHQIDRNLLMRWCREGQVIDEYGRFHTAEEWAALKAQPAN